MVDATRLRRLETVADAVREYREAMRRYLREQTHLLDAGVPFDTVTERNWGAFWTRGCRSTR